MSQGTILVVDDKASMRKMLYELLSDLYKVSIAEDGTRALALLSAGDFDLVISDIRMPGMDGFALLEEVKRIRPDVEVILITAYASIPRAVEAMKEGAYHYLRKPFEPDELLLLVDRAVERKRLAERARELEQELSSASRLDELVGKSKVMQRLFQLITRAGESEATVLITGESGTGKELVARAVHNSSPRRDGPFVAVNCGALPENLVESELFGYVKGAFTGATSDKRGLFEEAKGGTLFLDEVGDLPLPLQVKLTRVLQESKIRRVGDTRELSVDVRVIAATNVDVKQAVTRGRFRQDLYYRLNIFSIAVPPLRERAGDIPALCAHFLERQRHPGKTHVTGFSPEALSALARHPWPGNVRELENVVERAVAVANTERIQRGDLPDEITVSPGALLQSTDRLSHREFVDLARDRASREYLVSLMRDYRGNVTHAAEGAGVERESLHRLLKRHGIRPADFKDEM